jgi:hypothetical protein
MNSLTPFSELTCPFPPRVHDPMRGALANPWRCAALYGAPRPRGRREDSLAAASPRVPRRRSGWSCGRTWACNFLQPQPLPLRDAWAANSQRQPISQTVLPLLRRGLLGRGGCVSQAPRLQCPQFGASGGLAGIRALEIGDAVKQFSAWHSARPPWCRSFPYRCCRHRQRRQPRPIALFLRPDLLRTERE